MKTKLYRIAGHLIEVTFVDSHNDETLLPSFVPFVVKESSVDDSILTHIVIDDSYRPPLKGDEVGQFDCGGTNHGVYIKPDGGYQFMISDVRGERCAFMESNSDFSECKIVLLGVNWLQRNFGLNNSIMMAYAFSAATQNTVLMHASVVRKNGEGVLCLGKSGTGKSTHTGLWLQYIEDCDLMNDDNPIVRVIDGKAFVYGSPWSGKTPCYRNVVAPIAAFIQLQQKPENNISLEKPVAAFADLLPSCSTMKWDKRVFCGVCDTLSAVLAVAPCYLMGCLPNKAAAELSSSTIFA